MAQWPSELRLRFPQVSLTLPARRIGGNDLLTLHRFVVIASTRDMARKVFNSPTYAKPTVVDIAPKLLGHDNWVFLDGKAHVDFRKGLNGLFTRRALEMYLPGQHEVYNRYFDRFVQITKDNKGKAVPFMPEFRELMCAVSLRTFTGHYMSDEAVIRIANDYYLITAALELVNFPVIIPFTKAWYGKKAADVVLAEFSKAAAKSKVKMAAGGKPDCIMDAWIIQMIESDRYREAQDKGEADGIEKPSPLLRMFNDYEIAQTVFTFLFASQDATSSAATWLFQIMAQRPDVLDRVREENVRVRNGDLKAEVNMDQLESMTYTRAVVRELLRYRPPVLMVPYAVKKPFPITPDYTVPKGQSSPIWTRKHLLIRPQALCSFPRPTWLSTTRRSTRTLINSIPNATILAMLRRRVQRIISFSAPVLTTAWDNSMLS